MRFRHISTSGLGVGASRASYVAVLAISCTRYRVFRPLRSRLTLNDTRRRYFRFCLKRKYLLTAKWWQIDPYIVLKSNRKSGTASSLMRFRHISTSGFCICASRASIIAILWATVTSNIPPYAAGPFSCLSCL